MTVSVRDRKSCTAATSPSGLSPARSWLPLSSIAAMRGLAAPTLASVSAANMSNSLARMIEAGIFKRCEHRPEIGWNRHRLAGVERALKSRRNAKSRRSTVPARCRPEKSLVALTGTAKQPAHPRGRHRPSPRRRRRKHRVGRQYVRPHSAGPAGAMSGANQRRSEDRRHARVAIQRWRGRRVHRTNGPSAQLWPTERVKHGDDVGAERFKLVVSRAATPRGLAETAHVDGNHLAVVGDQMAGPIQS